MKIVTKKIKSEIKREYIVTNKIEKQSNAFSEYGITQCYISNKLNYIKQQFIDKYNLPLYKSNIETTLFVGMYSRADFIILKNHMGIKYFMFYGSDVNMLKHKDFYSSFTNIPIKTIFSLSPTMTNKLNLNCINSTLINVNIVNTELFKPTLNIGNKILIYNGIIKGREDFYNQEIYNNVIRELPNYQFVLTNEKYYEYNELPKLYNQCFIGIKLSDNGGSNNIINELKQLDIPVIHNGSGIQWSSAKSIIETIKENDKNLIVKKMNRCQYDMHPISSLNDKMMTDIYQNIDLMGLFLKPYKNILFICGDYPGYGGAATNCQRLHSFFSKNHTTYAIYYTYNKTVQCENDKYAIITPKKLIPMIRELHMTPDVIILKSCIPVNTNDLKQIIRCPIVFLIPGIYDGRLSSNIDCENITKKNISTDVIDQIKSCRYSFANSYKTQKILKNLYNIEVNLFYSSFVPYYGEKIEHCNVDNRYYDFGIIASNFTRTVKNIDECINKIIKLNPDPKKVILIGKYSNIYEHHGFICKDLCSPDEIQDYYKQIKTIVQSSFYESCSNVAIEALYHGCNIIQ